MFAVLLSVLGLLCFILHILVAVIPWFSVFFRLHLINCLTSHLSLAHLITNDFLIALRRAASGTTATWSISALQT